MALYNLLGICGSLRKASTNRLLLQQAIYMFDPVEFDFADLNLPLYDGDAETATGIPPDVQKLAGQIADCDAVVMSTPEYNKALSGVLKNALDWVSRTKPNPWQGKPVAIMSASAGRSGGERAQYSLRLCLTPFQPKLLSGPEMLVAGSGRAFDRSGKLSDERSLGNLSALMDNLRAEIA